MLIGQPLLCHRHAGKRIACSSDNVPQFFFFQGTVTDYLADTCLVGRFYAFYRKIVANGIIDVAFAHTAHHAINFQNCGAGLAGGV